MAYRLLSLDELVINRANDRHGELEYETAAIAWLFNNRETHMKSLAADIVEVGEIYEPPLVSPDGGKFIVLDGNRRLTCLKVLENPRRAPNIELQEYFSALRNKWKVGFPDRVMCQVESDRDRVDEILFRRHTGTQGGVGQSTWDDRMKANFINRTGKGNAISVADQVEHRLKAAGMMPGRRQMPRSTMNRLLSSEVFRNRVGFSIRKGRFEYTHQEEKVLSALKRIASDLAGRKIVLGNIWDTDGKTYYLNKLQSEGVLPGDPDRLTAPKVKEAASPQSSQIARAPVARQPTPRQRIHLIAKADYGIAWPGRLQRHRAIWEELQYHLDISVHRNAISVLFRVLLELSIENYISQTGLSIDSNSKFAIKALKIAADLQSRGKIDAKYMGIIKKFQNSDQLISADTFNRYVHSSNFAPSGDHLIALWDTLAPFIVECLSA